MSRSGSHRAGGAQACTPQAGVAGVTPGEDFYEDDEFPGDVLAAFRDGAKFVTARPWGLPAGPDYPLAAEVR